jgi:hypothetical protein
MTDILHLRKRIDTNCPMIFGGNWRAEHNKGWRWVRNLFYEDPEASLGVLDEYQTAHGVLNVTIGHPFSEDKMEPAVMPGYCGLYVRDVDDLVAELQRDLDDLTTVERWLRK